MLNSKDAVQSFIVYDGFCLRHILRDKRPSKTACPACWAMGTKKSKKCTVRRKIFCTGPTKAAKAEQKSLVPTATQQTQLTNQGKIPFICLL